MTEYSDKLIAIPYSAFVQAMRNAAIEGAREFAKIAGVQTKDIISQSEAERMDGVSRHKLNQMVSDGLITASKSGGGNHKVTYSRTEILTALKLNQIKTGIK